MWAGTMGFEVKPGVMSYIGEIDPTPVMQSLVAVAQASGDGVARSIHNLRRYRDGIAPLGIVRNSQEGIADVRANADLLMPRVSAAIEAQTPLALKFGTVETAATACR